MKIEQIGSFVAVCDYGGFTKAAEALHVSQPVVSRNISNLESELGCLLLSRTTHSVELTREGEAFLPHARAIMAEAEAAQDELRKLQEKRNSTLTVGDSFLYMSTITSKIVNKYAESVDRRITTRIVEKGTERIIDMVARGEIDTAFVGITDLGLIPSEVSSFMILRCDEKVLVAHGHRLDGRTSVRASDLEGETIVYPNAAPSRASSLVRGDLEDQGIPVSITFTSYEESALRVVEMGGGIIDVPAPYTSYHADVVEIPYECKRDITFMLIWNEKSCSATTRDFVRFTKGYVEGWKPRWA